MNYCGKHQIAIGNRVRFLGLSKFISKTPEQARAFTHKWLHGVTPREEMDPVIILMLELQKHADRIAEQRGLLVAGRGGSVKTCPLCAVVRMAEDESQDVRSLVGYGQVVLRLFQSNGLVRASDGLAEVPEPKTQQIDIPRIALS